MTFNFSIAELVTTSATSNISKTRILPRTNDHVAKVSEISCHSTCSGNILLTRVVTTPLQQMLCLLQLLKDRNKNKNIVKSTVAWNFHYTEDGCQWKYHEKPEKFSHYQKLTDLSTHTVWPWDTRFWASSHGQVLLSHCQSWSLTINSRYRTLSHSQAESDLNEHSY